MDIGNRLKLVRGNLKQEEFAQQIDCHKSTYGNWERGDQYPNAKDINKILKAFPEINPTWLLTGEGLMKRDELYIKEYPPEYRVEQEIGRDYVLIPRYGVAASAGGGALVHSEQIVDHLAFRSEWVKNALDVPVKDLALICVKGDSMEPTLSNGDLILIDMSTKRVEDNAIYVLRYNGTLLVKRIQRKLDGSVIIKSDNQLYEPELVSGDEVDQLQVVGRVVWSGRRM